MAADRTLYAGLMSGTSMDGVDAVLAECEGDRLQVLAHSHAAFTPTMRAELLALNSPGPDELHRATLAANALARGYHQALTQLLTTAQVPTTAVRALGAHGQTVRHRPGEFDGTGYTIQLFNGALMAELCGIDVVCDFRSRDVAAGGQGAPLVPAFHAAVFAQPGRAQAILNLGGIGNLTLVDADGSVSGFDCGPGNALMDMWCQRHLGQDFDPDGSWAAQGQVNDALLSTLLAEPYLHRTPPKSTGRDLFNADWLSAQLARPAGATALPAVDVQATLCDFTAAAAASALKQHLPDAGRLLVCGGGALNGHLMGRLAQRLPDVAVVCSSSAGLPPMQVEAAAFAWLAHAFVVGRPGNRPAVTGAAGLRLLGALYPAGALG